MQICRVTAMAQPNFPDSGAAMGAEPVGDYQRKTQSPVVWYALRYCCLRAVALLQRVGSTCIRARCRRTRSVGPFLYILLLIHTFFGRRAERSRAVQVQDVLYR